MNKQTMLNKAKAMNQVNSAIVSTFEKLQDVFTDKGAEVYKSNGELTKKIKDQLNDILKDSKNNLRSCFIEDRHNSISVKFDQIYATSTGNNFYKETIYIICKFENSNSDRAKVNVKANLDLEQFSIKWTAKKLESMQNKAEKLQCKIRSLKSELSAINYYLKD